VWIEEKEAECPSPSPISTEEKEVEISRLDRGERGYRGSRLDIGMMPPKFVSDSSSILCMIYLMYVFLITYFIRDSYPSLFCKESSTSFR
jgi:hypothetical protein